MRRNDRQITDRAEILRVISRCDCCRVGFSSPDGVYIVPLSFGFLEEEGGDVLYFHGAKEGRKAELIASNPQVGFEMDGRHALKTGEAACKYSYYYESICGTGTMRPVTDAEEKKRALAVIMSHYAPEREFSFTDAQAQSLSVFRLDIAQLSCKANPQPGP